MDTKKAADEESPVNSVFCDILAEFRDHQFQPHDKTILLSEFSFQHAMILKYTCFGVDNFY